MQNLPKLLHLQAILHLLDKGGNLYEVQFEEQRDDDAFSKMEVM